MLRVWFAWTISVFAANDKKHLSNMLAQHEIYFRRSGNYPALFKKKWHTYSILLCYVLIYQYYFNICEYKIATFRESDNSL